MFGNHQRRLPYKHTAHNENLNAPLRFHPPRTSRLQHVIYHSWKPCQLIGLQSSCPKTIWIHMDIHAWARGSETLYESIYCRECPGGDPEGDVRAFVCMCKDGRPRRMHAMTAGASSRRCVIRWKAPPDPHRTSWKIDGGVCVQGLLFIFTSVRKDSFPFARTPFYIYFCAQGLLSIQIRGMDSVPCQALQPGLIEPSRRTAWYATKSRAHPFPRRWASSIFCPPKRRQHTPSPKRRQHTYIVSSQKTYMITHDIYNIIYIYTLQSAFDVLSPGC